MNNINIKFDLDDNIAELKYNGENIKKNIKEVPINLYTKMITISYFFDNYKWVFFWSIWNNLEQFVEFQQYKKKEDNTDPWQTFAKWSYIDNPQKGTVQTRKVRRMWYKSELFDKVDNINFEVISTKYGNWNNNNCIDGYY